MSRLVACLTLALALGCSGKEEGPASLAIDVEALDLGLVPLGTTATATFTLTNEGGSSIEILSVSLVEGDSGLWRVTRGHSDPLGAGEFLDVTVSFSPEDEGAETGRVQVRSDDDANANLYVDLTGQGAPSTADDDGDGYSAATGDCDDGDAAVYPGADEICDGEDDDCDGSVPSDEADADYDGWRLCEDDCDDGDAAVYPGAPEICDHKDSDCDGTEADDDDVDGDGFSVCEDDCDDADDDVYPTAVEACDGADNDCSGEADDIDADSDGHSPCSPAGDCDDYDELAYPVVVDPEAGSGGDGTDAAPFDELSSALAALDGRCDTVALLAGTHEVAVSWTSGDVTVVGVGDDASEVILTPPEGSRAFRVSGGAALTLRDLTLAGAAIAGDGGAIWATESTVTLDGVVARGNSATGDGGAVAVSSGTLSIAGCTFEDNTADDDGGAVAVLSGSLDDLGSTYSGNQANSGGAVAVIAAAVDLDGVEVWSNTAAETGGGIAITAPTSLLVQRSVFALNTAGAAGGGVALVDVDDAGGVVRNLLVADNDGGELGGGVAVLGEIAAFTLANSTLLGNEATGEGGGLAVDADDASGLAVWAAVVVGSYGESGLYTSASSGADVAYCTVYRSSSGDDFAGGAAAGADENEAEDPLLAAFSNDGDPTNDDPSLSSGSPARDSGPPEPAWSDPDGTRNDRGVTGGPGAE